MAADKDKNTYAGGAPGSTSTGPLAPPTDAKGARPDATTKPDTASAQNKDDADIAKKSAAAKQQTASATGPVPDDNSVLQIPSQQPGVQGGALLAQAPHGAADIKRPVGDEHVAAGADDQFLAAGAASKAANGNPWDVFCRLHGIQPDQAAAVGKYVAKHYAGAYKTDKDWQAIIDEFATRKPE